MVEKLSKKTKSTPYVKCTITNELAESLNTLEEKIGIVRADVVRAALHEHIQNHYSAYLPKSKSEIMNEVKQKYYFEKYNKEFRNLEFMKEQIPILEEHKKKLQSQLSDDEKKLNTVKKKINEKAYTNKIELKELENKKTRFEDSLKYKKNLKKQNDKKLEECKKGIFVEGALL